MKLTLLAWHQLTCGCTPDDSPKHFLCCPKHLLAEQLVKAVAQDNYLETNAVMRRMTERLDQP